ncbi:class I SAM-dependent methyltransferase [Salipaludibacillus sp. CUR1]|uniref:class I SAM-dependent methyltransferase n=1 Tax=Salipaludibacillus sp. CUR1 TaxID=2820003 RepID=UPI001E4877BB|nr:class I SAM-dependent methyltransferase [Salipaludibacillus sp. CUR1]
MSELNRFIHARHWMKSNENFLTTWHAHVGYKLDLFHHFAENTSVSQVADQCSIDLPLLIRWVEVGLEVGHLKKSIRGKIKAKKKMVKYASAHSSESVGILLREMMELHIPALLEYPELMKTGERITYLEDKFAEVVAETSTLLEKAAVPPVLKWIKKEQPNSIVDMGCGYGGYLKNIHDRFPDIELQGVEINKQVCEKAEAALNGAVPVYNGDMVEFIESFNNKVDLVMAHNLLYYFPKEEREELYTKISRILNKGGSVTFITPVMEAKYGQTFTTAFNTFMTVHDNLYPLPTLDEIKRDSKKAKLKVKEVTPLIKEGGWYLVTLRKTK